MAILRLALLSLLNRRFTAGLTVLSIALSVALLVGVERLRTEAREGFANTISGTDLIVGARSGPVQLLLYSVFHMGNATSNLSWASYQALAAHPRVAWAVPLSLGDSHRGFRVLGTSADYFTHYGYGRGRRLELRSGRIFDDVFDAVLGAEVAERLGYTLGEQLVIAHGAAQVSFATHDDKPFRVVGILERTGTPVDRTVHVSLAGIEAVHVDWQGGVRIPGRSATAEAVREMDLTPKTVTAVLVGVQSKVSTFQVQRFVNEYPDEALLAILPGVALQELWQLVGVAENALLAVSVCVVVVGILGMLTSLLTSLNERRREMAILRAMGARPTHVFALVMGEAAFLTLLGILAGLGFLYGLLYAIQPVVEAQLGFHLAVGLLSLHEMTLLAAVLIAGVLAGTLPSYRAYRYSLVDGMTIRV
jgi:putative ABC transport system permease protein